MRQLLAGLALTLALVARASGEGTGTPALLDDQKFFGVSGEAGHTLGRQATIWFADGRLQASALEPFGVQPARYRAWHSDSFVRFEADVWTREGAWVHWDGLVVGDHVDATFIWWPAQGRAESYWFHGRTAKSR